MKTFKQYILESQQAPKTDKFGTKRWYNEKGQLHRDNDLPAVEYANGTREWWKNGKRHRDDDKPAVEFADGGKWWCKNGELHRDSDLPALEWERGLKEWYKHNKRHRENGPASIKDGEAPRYFLEGKEYTEEEFKAEMRRRKMLNAYKRGDTDRSVTDDLEDIGHVI